MGDVGITAVSDKCFIYVTAMSMGRDASRRVGFCGVGAAPRAALVASALGRDAMTSCPLSFCVPPAAAWWPQGRGRTTSCPHRSRRRRAPTSCCLCFAACQRASSSPARPLAASAPPYTQYSILPYATFAQELRSDLHLCTVSLSLLPTGPLINRSTSVASL